jgi:Organic solute transporter Ostalpha
VNATCSLLTLRFIDARLYLDPIRECYEAFVIYNFYMFLIAYLEVGAK